MSVTFKQVVYFGVASLALIALAAPLPDIATGFVVLLLVGTIITHASELTPYFQIPK